MTALIESGYRFFGAGGATGFDTVTALSVLKIREMHSHIRLILVLPHRAQTKRWSKKDIAVYEDIKNRADKVVYISDEFTRDCVYRRNRHFINGSSMCICYLSREGSGTDKTVRGARTEYSDRARFCKVNVDDEPELSARFGIASVPTLIFFKNGEILKKSVGYREKDELEETLKELL